MNRHNIEIRLLLLLLLLLGLTAIIVAVDLVPIQSHLESSTVSAINIADDGHRPIHLTLNNAIGVTTTGPAVRRLDDRPAMTTRKSALKPGRAAVGAKRAAGRAAARAGKSVRRSETRFQAR